MFLVVLMMVYVFVSLGLSLTIVQSSYDGENLREAMTDGIEDNINYFKNFTPFGLIWGIPVWILSIPSQLIAIVINCFAYGTMYLIKLSFK